MTHRRKCRECGRLMSPNRSAPVCPRCVAERKEPVAIAALPEGTFNPFTLEDGCDADD